MLGLIKVVVVMAVMATVGGLAVHWAKDETTAAIHRTVDTSLPGKVSAHPWAPLSHGKPAERASVVFSDGSVTTVRCRVTLGTYSVHIDHAFSFQKDTAPIKRGCPGLKLRRALVHASRVTVDDEDTAERMTLTNDQGHPVATFQASGR
jgi:hypothetical protein